MTQRVGDIMSPGRKYIKDGEERTEWHRCGVLLRKENGKFIVKLDTIPVGLAENQGFMQVFEPREQQQRPQQQAPQGFRDKPQQQGLVDEDVPF